MKEFLRDNALIDHARRDFLLKCCQSAGATLIPVCLRTLSYSSIYFLDSSSAVAQDTGFHVHPHYRMQRPLDATLLKVQAGSDEYITEKYADQINSILAVWSSALLKSVDDLRSIGKAFAPNFVASSPKPAESRLVRSSLGLEVHQNKFAQQTVLTPDDFLTELQEALSHFSKIITAEFQIVGIEAIVSPANLLKTHVRYELVGSGYNFHREQRVGHWNLDWESAAANEFRLRSWQWLDETLSRSARPIFVDITATAFSNNPSYSAQMLHGIDYWRTVLDGACGIDIYGHNGVSVADIDNDGFDDVYICQPAGLPNRLYRNRGDGTFEDLTETSGLGILENTACALFADFNNDGHQDVIVVRANGPLLFLNEGGGKFRRQPDAFQFANPPQGTFTGAAVADYDGDGWLDIYFCLYAYYQGTDQYKYPLPYYAAENGPPNFMMKNNRDGTFRDVTAESDLNQNNTRYSFCCGWSDFNSDGWPDLYVVNDFGRKNLYRNNGNGTFTDVAAAQAVEDTGAGMSVCWFDYDNDGAQDLYVANMWTAAGERISTQGVFKKDAPIEVRKLYQKHAMGNSLLHNLGNTFQDITASSSVGMGRWSWSSDAWDFDHDGLPDLYITNGMITGPSCVDLNSFFWRQVVAESPNDAKPSPNYEQGWSAINELIRADGTWSGFERNVFHANNRDGTFSDVSAAVGMDFLEDGRAFALSDFDHDGRQEVFLKNRNGPQLRLLKNVSGELPPSISFRLTGTKSNRDAIGATVTVQTELNKQTRFLQAGSGFLSQHSKDVCFGLGDAKGPLHASIRWPSGLVQELHDLPRDHRVWVEEGVTPSRMEPFNKSSRAITPASIDSKGIELLPHEIETWLLAPLPAPLFSLPDLSGQAHDLISYRGKCVMLNFWVSKSADCQRNLTAFNRLYERWTAQGLQILTVNVDEAGDFSEPQSIVRQNHFSFPVLHGSDDNIGVYNILYRHLFDRHRDLNLPTSFLVNEQGEIVKVYQGLIDPEHIEQDFHHIPKTFSERLAKGLPFRAVSDTFEFGRNQLSLGSVFFQRGYFDQAETAFQLALQDNSNSAEALYGLGSVYLNQQKNAEAQQSFDRAIKGQAGYPGTLPNAWNNLGLLATREGHIEEAIGYFQQALRLSPDHSVALVNLGSAYRQKKNWPEARSTFERALRINEKDAEANYGLAMVFAQTESAQQAEQYLRRALQSRPDYPEALNNLGVLYLRTQRRDEAVATFEKCISAAPAFDQSYLNLARVYAVEGTPEKARSLLLELLKQHPNQTQAQQMLEQLGR